MDAEAGDFTHRDPEWADLVQSLRKRLSVSQDELAEKLDTNQCTISRWERGVTRPNYRMRTRLLGLLEAAPPLPRHDLEPVAEVAQQLFDSTTVPSLMLDRHGIVVAVSSSNEYRPGMKYRPGLRLIDQTLPRDMDKARHFFAWLEEVDFWNTPQACFTYSHEIEPEIEREGRRCYVVTSVPIASQVFCLLQRMSCIKML